MPEFEVSDETLRKIRAFKRVIDGILQEKLASESNYIDLILTLGLHEMLRDSLPKEEVLLRTMIDMFDKNPEFVSDFIAETLEGGKLIQQEEEIKRKWSSYVI